ncbi:hypothetical protein NQ314_009700 [Rhamnusium bicolor]|uniref:Uncharacterized protein n=1 Tax=Rhamnusium bicolor TaxID=1586634 RepID=A0AAV8XWU1_9CUCU|nr:hypothetical protein NQ314_009700 [Rhamnusium bicolor]
MYNITTNLWNLRKREKVTTSAEDKKHNIESFQKFAENKTDLTEIQKGCYRVEHRTRKMRKKT